MIFGILLYSINYCEKLNHVYSHKVGEGKISKFHQDETVIFIIATYESMGEGLYVGGKMMNDSCVTKRSAQHW